jgi:hypothetical protein
VPLSRPKSKRASPAKSSSSKRAKSSRSKARAEPPDDDLDEDDHPTPTSWKGKGRADPDEEEDYGDELTFMPGDADSPENYDDGWDDDMADITDFHNYNYEPIDIPDFEILPSTQPPRPRTPTPICISVQRKTSAKGAAARKAALAGSFSSTPGDKDIPKLTLVSSLPPAVREFYENHFRRGADEEDEDEDPDDFGVAAVVQKRAFPRGRSRAGGGGRGRGRGGKRTWAKRRK